MVERSGWVERDGWSCQEIEFDERELSCLVFEGESWFGSAVRKKSPIMVLLSYPGLEVGEPNKLHSTCIASEVNIKLSNYMTIDFRTLKWNQINVTFDHLRPFDITVELVKSWVPCFRHLGLNLHIVLLFWLWVLYLFISLLPAIKSSLYHVWYQDSLSGEAYPTWTDHEVEPVLLRI